MTKASHSPTVLYPIHRTKASQDGYDQCKRHDGQNMFIMKFCNVYIILISGFRKCLLAYFISVVLKLVGPI